MDNFYIECKSEEESKLCEKWAIDNGLQTKDYYGYTEYWNRFVVKNGYYTCNYRNHKVENISDDCYGLPEKTLADLNINTSTEEKDWSKASKEELLEEAKRRYPVGTKFRSLYSPGSIRTVRNGVFNYKDSDKVIIDNGPESGNYIFRDGKWAEIISTPNTIETIQEEIQVKDVKESVETPKFKVGHWYKNLGPNKDYYGKVCEGDYTFPCKEYIAPSEGYIQSGTYFGCYEEAELLIDLSEIQQYLPKGHVDKISTKPKEITEYAGLKIGDKLPRNIICDWAEIGINKYSDGWIQASGMFVSDRYIKSFKELDGIVGFLVSGTDNVYLKADGFKEFMDSYSKSTINNPTETKSSDYEAVHVDTQEKWDFVSKKLGYTYEWASTSTWGCYTGNSCIVLDHIGFGSKLYYESKEVISFEEWLRLTDSNHDWMLFICSPKPMVNPDGIINLPKGSSITTSPDIQVKFIDSVSTESEEDSLFPTFVSKIN